MQPHRTNPIQLIHRRELHDSTGEGHIPDPHKPSSSNALAPLEGYAGLWNLFFVELIDHCKQQCLLNPVRLSKCCMVELTAFFAVRPDAHPRLGCLATAVTLVGVSACGSGSGAAPDSPPVAATVQVQIYYDPDSKLFPQESGPVLLGSDGQPSTIKHGLWTTWHTPNQGNTMQFEKTYVNGKWDTTAYWREWNPDTSLRFEGSDQ